jgi:hypothetical protein
MTLLAATTPITAETPQPDWFQSDCGWAVKVIEAGELGWYWQLDDPEQRAEFYDVCHEVAPYFSEEWVALLGKEGGGPADLIHAMAVLQCESGLDTYANTRRWGGGTDGLWSFMEHLNWPDRLGFPWLDVFDTTDATFLASLMIYNGVNPKVDAPNFWWWWSCSRSYQVIRRLGIPVPEASYCPPGEYWNDVREGSGVAARKDCGA